MLSFIVTRPEKAHVYRLSVNTLLTRIYGKSAITHHNYSTTLASVAFAGTIVGMLTFGYLSDKLGRKFGMVRHTSFLYTDYSPQLPSVDGCHWHRRLLFLAIRCLVRRPP